MIDLIRAMFATPESQADSYVWAAALLGHWGVGAGLLAFGLSLWARSPWTIVAIISAAYGAGWEGGQALAAASGHSLTLALLADGVLDWAAVSLGTVTAAAVWLHARKLIAAAIAAIVIILTAGIGRKR